MTLSPEMSPTGISDGLRKYVQSMQDRTPEIILPVRTLTANYADTAAYMLIHGSNEVSLYITYTPSTAGNILYVEPSFNLVGVAPWYVLQKVDISTGQEVDDVRYKLTPTPLPSDPIYFKISMKCDVVQYMRLRFYEAKLGAAFGTVAVTACEGR